MNILITGNLGYIGSRLTELISKLDCNIYGLDIGFYVDENTEKTENFINQYIQDIRNFEPSILKKIDVLIHLAAMSNDPLGELNPIITRNINFVSSINLIENAIKQNVKQIIVLSTQSIYGYSNTNIEMKEDDENKNPITEYAKSKWELELALSDLKNKSHITILRPSTVFGYSKRIRSDIVLNNLVINAYINKNIIVLSDGTPWRPVIHIDDLCDCIINCIINKKYIKSGQAFNLGLNNGNYQIKDLAKAVSKIFNNMNINYTNEHSDPRSYRVSFEKYNSLFQNEKIPNRSIDHGIKELINNFERINFSEIYNNKSSFKRLDVLKKLIKEGKINKNLIKNDI